jgi:hypothetical protein
MSTKHGRHTSKHSAQEAEAGESQVWGFLGVLPILIPPFCVLALLDGF